MLRLEKMEICGFKSFSDRTVAEFRPGITAVVGPNGCGKSNIGDAINWVLGEQSAKMLRGQQMSDVIFNGSETRKPQGLAEVTLTFAGAEELQRADQGRLSVTRRLFRSGESEYAINGARVRLKDVQEVLREGRVGARTYATIEQGRIDQVLNAKPKERRALIEDAAGISGYKHKRRLSELKLEATHANLLRVNDIVVEVQRQINTLKRQAAKARRYRKLRDELRNKELSKFSFQAKILDARLAQLIVEENDARHAEAEASARVGRLEAELIQQREALEQANRRFREASEVLHRLDIEIDREESRIRDCKERITESIGLKQRQLVELQSQAARREELVALAGEARRLAEERRDEMQRLANEHDRAQFELDVLEQELRDLRRRIETSRQTQFGSMSRAVDLRNRIRSTEESIERIGLQRARIEAEELEAREDWSRTRNEAATLEQHRQEHQCELQRLREQLAQTERELEQTRERHSHDVDSLAASRELDHAVLARLSTMEDIATRFAGESDGVKSLLTSGAGNGIRTHGVVADYVEAHRDVEGAAEGYLRALLPTVILEDDGDAQRAAVLLRSQGASRTTLICRSHPAGALAVGTNGNVDRPPPADFEQDPRVLGRLRESLQLKVSANGVLGDRIGDALLVDSLETALELHRRYPVVDYLTREGEVVYASGVISVGGKRSGVEGLLTHKRKTADLKHESQQIRLRTDTLQRKVDESREQLMRLELASREAREAAALADRRGVELELHLKQSSEERERTGRRSEVLAAELARLVAEAEPLRELLQRTLGERQAAEEQHREVERELQTLGAGLEAAETLLKQRGEKVAELRAHRAAAEQRQQSVDADTRRAEDSLAEIEKRLEAARTTAAEASRREDSARELQASTEDSLGSHVEQRGRTQHELGRMELETGERQSAQAGHERGLREGRGDLESLREVTRGAELERMRTEESRKHLDELCRQELGMSTGEALTNLGTQADGQPPDIALLERQVQEIREAIESIGPVNMTAIEEFTELEQRHEFLTSQKTDLEQSMESLRETIRRINRQSRQKFLEAFEAIRLSYQEVYKLLFSGGRADLRLEEGEDVLDCGIEILAQPPGKRLSGVHLLSGGEKALSAIALLFAIFRYSPSPFCLLDEVDAPLDDSNVSRFANMVKEYARNTQFILITHNKLSMDAANLLYGVTMEEPGISKLVSIELR